MGEEAHRRAGEARLHYAPAEPRALGTLALLAVAAILWVLVPVGSGILLGTVLALTTYRYYRPLARRTRRPALVALGVTAVTTAVVTGTLGLLTYLLALKGVAVFAGLPRSLAPGGAADQVLRRMARPLAVVHLEPAAVAEKLSGASGEVAASAAGWAARLASTVFDGLLALFFMSATMYFVLRRWSQIGRAAERLMPINPRHTRRLIRETHRLGYGVVVGNFGTAVLQGAIGGAGYAVARTHEAALLGAATAVASLVPVFGTMLVWVPIGLVLAATHHAVAAVFVLSWGAIAVVGFCDYVVRPQLVGRSETMSTWMTLVALFGGLKVFGFLGVLLGPMLIGLALATLRVYERARRFRLDLH